MTISTKKKVWTDEEFMALSKDGHRYELVNGEIVDLGNSGMEHGYIACILTIALGGYVRANKLGAICDSSIAFTLKNGNKHSPDFSFIAKNRLQGLSRPPRGFFQGSPDLAVEILSPNNTVEEIHDKIVEYFENDTRLVWVIHPDEKYVLVYHSPEPDRVRVRNDNLRRSRHRLRQLQQSYASGTTTLEELIQRLQSWEAHLLHGDTYRLRQSIFDSWSFSRDESYRRPVKKPKKSEPFETDR